jgi:Tol biopolymer transport system component
MRPFLALSLVAALAAPAAGQAAYKPVSVLESNWVDILPAASEDYLAYSQLTAKSGGVFNVWVKPAAGPRFMVSAPGRNAFAGSIDGTTLVYEHRKANGRGQIKLVDLVTRQVQNEPVVNTVRHESNPAISGDYLLFNRSPRPKVTSPRRVILRNLDTRTRTVLDKGGEAYVQTGGIAGNYAAWIRCNRFDRCRIWVYDIAADTKRVLPNPKKRSQYAVGVTADGTVYYAESRTILCDPRKVVRIWRQPVGAPRELVWKLWPGRDPSHLSPVVLPDDSVEIYFDRFNCRTGQTAVLKSVIPAPPP